MKKFEKTTVELFRDCLRLAKYVAGNSTKGTKLKQMIKSEFSRNKHVTDLEIIEQLKGHAIRGLSGYLMMESSNKDKRFQSKANEFTTSEAASISTSKSNNQRKDVNKD